MIDCSVKKRRIMILLLRHTMIWVFLLVPLLAKGQENQYTVVFLNSRSDAPQLDRETGKLLMQQHLAHINRLAAESKLLIAGPFDGGGGIFVMNTNSTDEARIWISSDPAVQAGRWTIELMPYTPRIGAVCPVKGDVEYAEYTLVRFNAIVEKFNAGTYPNLIRQHELFISERIERSNIVTEAIFGPNEGGILVLRDEVHPDTFVADPAVRGGLIDVIIKKLYIARTSFCEP